MTQRWKNMGGALLIEALVSFGLMFVFAITAFGLQAHARKARAKGRSIIAATCLARGVLDEARVQGYDQLAYGEIIRTERVEVEREGIKVGQQFEVVRQIRTGPSTDIKSVMVEVKWNSGEVNLEGYIGK